MRKVLYSSLLVFCFWLAGGSVFSPVEAESPINTAHFILSYSGSTQMPYYTTDGSVPYQIELTVASRKKDPSALPGVRLGLVDRSGAEVFSTFLNGNGTTFYFLTNRPGAEVPDLVYLFQDGTGFYVGDFRIIGKVDGKFQELFNAKELSEDARILLSGQLHVLQSHYNGKYALLLSSQAAWATLVWDGTHYVFESVHQRGQN